MYFGRSKIAKRIGSMNTNNDSGDKMTPDTTKPDRWYSFLLALIIILLGGVGTLVLVVNNQTKEMVITLNAQTWNKLDRISTLFMHERDLMIVFVLIFGFMIWHSYKIFGEKPDEPLGYHSLFFGVERLED